MPRFSIKGLAAKDFVISSGAAITALLLIIALGFSLSFQVASAQQATETPTEAADSDSATAEADFEVNPICSTVRLNVLPELARCQETGKGEACYASDIIRAEPVEAVDDFFTTPGDIEPLDAFARITTSPADGDNWGVALLNLGLFDDLEDSDVQVVLMGDARFEFMEDEEGYLFSSRDVTCTEAPSAVAIRVPDGENITLTINGAPITVGSIIVLRTTSLGNVMSLMTVEGTVLLSQPEGEIPVVVSEGEVSERCLGDAEDLGLDGIANDQVVSDDCAWSAPRLMTLDEQKIAESAIIVFAGLDGNFSLTDALTDDPDATEEPLTDSDCPNGGQDYVHTVQRGEILFKIAQRYTVTVSQIAQDNNITNPDRIFPGQELDITCGIDRGTSTFPPPVTCPATSACITRAR
jgi:hypothetical protein